MNGMHVSKLFAFSSLIVYHCPYGTGSTMLFKTRVGSYQNLLQPTGSQKPMCDHLSIHFM